jgi:short-subunit dehydrogenase
LAESTPTTYSATPFLLVPFTDSIYYQLYKIRVLCELFIPWATV